MQIEIITIGNEVLSGRTVDTNFAWLARALEEVSVQVGWHTTVGDDAERIAEALQARARARRRGGDDRRARAHARRPDPQGRRHGAGRPLQLDEDVLERIRERGEALGRRLPASVEAQALMPRGAQAWPNRLGTAPGSC